MRLKKFEALFRHVWRGALHVKIDKKSPTLHDLMHATVSPSVEEMVKAYELTRIRNEDGR